MPFPTIRILDIIDIILVALFTYQLYILVRKSNVIRIFWAIVVLYLAWRLFEVLDMHLSSSILGGIMNVGLIALVIVFQPELRKFLLMIGTKTEATGFNLHKRIISWHDQSNASKSINLEPYVQACMHMSSTKTGALIIFKRNNEVEDIIETGERINALVSAPLLEALFFKNSPLHDGAVIVQRNSILAARCILPVTARIDIDPNLGLRHRSAIGVTEQLDVLAVIVSEETGAISYALGGEIHHDVGPVNLRHALESALNTST